MRSVAILVQAKRSMYPYVSLHAIRGPLVAATSGEAVPLHLLSLVRPVTVKRDDAHLATSVARRGEE